MTDLVNQIREGCKAELQRITEVRRHLHRYPELSFQEHKTAAYLEAALTEAGISHHRVIDTGIVAVIEGKNPSGRTVVIRGDIDALPITEDTGLDFASENKGIMHACGHDVHSSCVFGAAVVLHKLRDQWEGTLKIVFQPGEEKLPGGASKLLAAGELDHPQPNAMLGQHVYPELEAGKIGIRPGMYMASADEIYVSVTGPGGHAALPDRTVDIIYAASHLIQSLQQVVSRNAPPLIPSVLTFGHIEGHGATNVIPREVKIEGTFRTFDEDWRAKAHERIRSVANGVASATGAGIELEIRKGYPHLYNNPELTSTVRNLAKEFVGAANVVDLDMRMTSEDFAYYSHAFDSCFWRLGVRKPGDEIRNLHTPGFRVDEEALEVGAGFMAYSALNLLVKG